jgi:chemotaxis protein MotB
VQELARFRSEFFGRLRSILSQRSDIRVVGDRFVFQSEVLFPKGSASINPAGDQEIAKLAAAITELETEIPSDIAWVLRVDGHTDNDPIRSAAFQSNWELSSARAIAVVRLLIEEGVSPNRLVAAGFGEFQPIDPGDSEEAKARNRRIELKLTER